MKKNILIPLLTVTASICSFNSDAERIVFIHTNDTHSQIDPNDSNKGGVLRRKVLIDSLRTAEPFTLLVDVGDAVQGTVYYNIFGGEVEAKVLNNLGYDYAILGNHEFDNGIDSLAKYIQKIDAQYISTNYDVSGTPLESLITPYKIVEIAGKRIGIIGINVNPDGIIDPGRCQGITYLDMFTAANSTAWHLKHNDKVDYVVALTHIGYFYEDLVDDIELISSSSNIDILIGGHSHTVITPRTEQASCLDTDNNSVLMAQTGNAGTYVGTVTIDTDNNSITSRLYPVDSRYDNRDEATVADLAEIIAPYRHAVDSVKSIKFGKSDIQAAKGDEILLNFVTDFVAAKGTQIAPDNHVDFAIANRGGIRNGLSKGTLTKGNIIEMLPFANYITILDLKGNYLLDLLKINAEKKRIGFSDAVRVTIDPETNDIVLATVNNEPIDPERTYRIATIDYLANGGDYMKPLKKGIKVAASNQLMWEDMIEYIKTLKRKTAKASSLPRIIYFSPLSSEPK